MAKYEMQEMNLPNGEGKRVLYPRMVLDSKIDTAQMAKLLSQSTTFNAAEVKGFLAALADQLSYELAQGRPVKLDGLGTFTPSLALREGKEFESEEDGERRNAQSIEVGGVKFRPDKQMLDTINKHCTLERAKTRFKRSSEKYTSEQRLEIARKYLAENAYMRIADYVALTGLRPTTASLELRRWAADPESGIRTSGRGTHKVYVADQK